MNTFLYIIVFPGPCLPVIVLRPFPCSVTLAPWPCFSICVSRVQPPIYISLPWTVICFFRTRPRCRICVSLGRTSLQFSLKFFINILIRLFELSCVGITFLGIFEKKIWIFFSDLKACFMILAVVFKAPLYDCV